MKFYWTIQDRERLEPKAMKQNLVKKREVQTARHEVELLLSTARTGTPNAVRDSPSERLIARKGARPPMGKEESVSGGYTAREAPPPRTVDVYGVGSAKVDVRRPARRGEKFRERFRSPKTVQDTSRASLGSAKAKLRESLAVEQNSALTMRVSIAILPPIRETEGNRASTMGEAHEKMPNIRKEAGTYAKICTQISSTSRYQQMHILYQNTRARVEGHRWKCGGMGIYMKCGYRWQRSCAVGGGHYVGEREIVAKLQQALVRGNMGSAQDSGHGGHKVIE
ncbi:hypothetical protein C8R45DRAFT_943459 [Mycena sanguinolenta]|nr:hypothetical protein C8R45DRAFT_943459 [Mycena sanguinolenta]